MRSRRKRLSYSEAPSYVRRTSKELQEGRTRKRFTLRRSVITDNCVFIYKSYFQRASNPFMSILQTLSVAIQLTEDNDSLSPLLPMLTSAFRRSPNRSDCARTLEAHSIIDLTDLNGFPDHLAQSIAHFHRYRYQTRFKTCDICHPWRCSAQEVTQRSGRHVDRPQAQREFGVSADSNGVDTIQENSVSLRVNVETIDVLFYNRRRETAVTLVDLPHSPALLPVYLSFCQSL